MYSQVAIINECSSDPSMFDGSGGEFIELYCPPGGACDISCWVVSDGQGIVTIPDGTIMSAGSFYLIGHAPSLNCDSCDFFGISLDLNTATCNCLNGGSYGTGIDGNDALVLGRFGNAGELVLLYNSLGVLLESWSFDNAVAAYLPSGGLISGASVAACPAIITNIPAADSSIITDIGANCLGCNTSYARVSDGATTWITDNHPTPGASNLNNGDNAFEYQFSIDGGLWQTIPKTSVSNIDSYRDTFCMGDSIRFRVQIENYQHAVLEVFDSSGRYGSYFRSSATGIVAWSTIEGLATALSDTLRLVSQSVPVNTGNNYYTLQWSDFKNGLGSFSSNSSNECYERMNYTLVRHQMVDSATIVCTDPSSGISQVTAYPIGVDGFGTDVFYVLYDDIGDLSNPIDINQSGLFQLSSVALVAYYVEVQGLCNEVIAQDLGAFCLAIQPCPQIDTSYFLMNNNPCGLSSSAVYVEDFENGTAAYSTSIAECSDGSEDYFTNTDGTNIAAAMVYNGASGNYFAASDIDGACGGAASPTGESLIISGIDISSCTSVSIQIDAAEDDDGANEDWDGSDFVHIDVNIDGAGFIPALWFESQTTTFNTEPLLDTDFDGLGDGLALSNTFQTFVSAVLGSGSTLDIRITIALDAGDEDIALDNITVLCVSTDTCQACPYDTLTFGVDGTNLPNGGLIEWYYDTLVDFSPYLGEGTWVGTTVIPPVLSCASSSLVINEIMYRPATNNGQNPNTGEMIELLGPPGMNIGCFVITDGDWTITIPPGTVIPPDGIFTIGNDNVHGAGTFDLDAESCACFTEAPGGEGLLIFTDGGEYVAIFDGAGTFVQGVIFGSPTAGNLPPNGATTVGGVVPTIGISGCQSSVTIPPSSVFETAPGGAATGTSLIRSPDGTGAWTTQSGGSINSCNLAVPPLPIPEFDYEVPLEACNQTRIYKGVIVPHPNTAACPNTDPSAMTKEYIVEVICPSALLQGDSAFCAANLPIDLPVTTNNVASGTSLDFIYTVDGVIDTLSTTVSDGSFTFSPTSTAVYAGVEIKPQGSCAGPVDSSVQITIINTPNAPVLPSPIIVCEGDTALIAPSGAPLYDWSLFADFSVIDTKSAEYLMVAPDSVYVRSINTDSAASVFCMGPAVGIEVLTEVCDVIILSNELFTFEAQKIKDKGQLDWVYESFNEASSFVLERSKDGIYFEYLADVALTESTHYSYIDQTPLIGWNYYRLQYPVALDGVQYSAIRALNFDDKSQIEVYPSPSNGLVHVNINTSEHQAIKIKVYDNIGAILLQTELEKGKTTYAVNLSEMAAAVYFITVELNSSTHHYKVIKQ